jgi:hypothetical protein
MAKAVKGKPRKPYAAPVLTIHGTVRELTQANQTGGKPDHGTKGFRIKTSF